MTLSILLVIFMPFLLSVMWTRVSRNEGYILAMRVIMDSDLDPETKGQAFDALEMSSSAPSVVRLLRNGREVCTNQ